MSAPSADASEPQPVAQTMCSPRLYLNAACGFSSPPCSPSYRQTTPNYSPLPSTELPRSPSAPCPTTALASALVERYMPTSPSYSPLPDRHTELPRSPSAPWPTTALASAHVDSLWVSANSPEDEEAYKIHTANPNPLAPRQKEWCETFLFRRNMIGKTRIMRR